MTVNTAIKYLTLLMILLSPIFSYGAYAAAFLAFVVLLIKKPQEVKKLLIDNKAFLYLLIAVTLSTVFSKSIYYSLLIDGVILLHFMAFAVLLDSVKEENIEGMYKLLNMLAIMICLIGLYQYFSGNLIINKSWTDQKTFGSLIRIYSTLRNPNIFAGYLTFNLSLVVSRLVKNKTDIFSSINLVLSSACLILTYSRGGFIAFIAAMLVVMVLSKDIKVGAYLGIMCVMYYSYNTIGSINRAGLGIINTDSSSLYRMEIWKQSFNLFKKNILVGRGPGSVMKYLSYSSDKLIGFIAHSHNIYLHLLAETGLLGITAFSYLILSSIKKFLLYWKENKQSQYLYIAIAFAASLSALLVHGMVDCVVLLPTRSLIFMVYLSLFPAIYRSFCKTAV